MFLAFGLVFAAIVLSDPDLPTTRNPQSLGFIECQNGKESYGWQEDGPLLCWKDGAKTELVLFVPDENGGRTKVSILETTEGDVYYGKAQLTVSEDHDHDTLREWSAKFSEAFRNSYEATTGRRGFLLFSTPTINWATNEFKFRYRFFPPFFLENDGPIAQAADIRRRHFAFI
jgi:hypothetical protein